MSGREGRSWTDYFRELVAAGRADRIELEHAHALWYATERVDELRAVAHSGQDGSKVGRADAVRELLRGRLGITGPVTASQLGMVLNLFEGEADVALAALEGEGVILRGRFTPGAAGLEWCERRLLARIHRYTLNRLRAEIEPVSAADFMRFLFAWQRLDPDQHVSGLEGLAALIGQLDGFELPAAAWEPEVLSSRCDEYDPALLDTLCTTGRVAWGRISAARSGPPAAGARSGGPIRSSPIALFLRAHTDDWMSDTRNQPAELSTYAGRVQEVLERRGASFFHELVAVSGLLATQVEQALAELAGAGLVTSDSFAGLRALITPSNKRKPLSAGRTRHRKAPVGIESAGRWSLLRRNDGTGDLNRSVELYARTLLLRYGVVFKRLLARESGAPPWRELLLVYRRLEARGEIRGGRFVSGMSGEQFALPEAVGQLRSIRRLEGGGRLIGISAADPLNLTGIITPGERVPGLTSNRVLYRDGVPILAREAGEVKSLVAGIEPSADLVHALVRKQTTAALRRYLGMTGAPSGTVPLNRKPGQPRKRQADAAHLS
jgi:ATP-dependent Lhr-like helicase